MELKQLQSLMTLVQCQSFTKAAEKLYISQPTISTHIRMLEEELQSKLIIRTTKSIEVTPHGQELYEYACKVFEWQERMLSRWRREDEKTIRLGVSTIPADYIIPELFPAFHVREPEIQFDIHQSDSRKILDGILDGSFKLGMVGMKSTEQALVCRPFFRDHMVMITPAQPRFGDLESREASILECILQEPVILREQGSGSRKSLETYFDKMRIEENRLHVVARLNDQEAIKKLVAAGLGISFISEKAAEDYKAAGKIYTVVLPSAVYRNLYLVYRKDYILKDHILRFIDFTLHYYGYEPAGSGLNLSPDGGKINKTKST